MSLLIAERSSTTVASEDGERSVNLSSRRLDRRETDCAAHYREKKGDKLSIAWLYGEFRAGVIRNSTLIQTWESPTLVDGSDSFARALDLAVRNLRFSGKDVSLLLEIEGFSHHVESVPNASNSIQRKVLYRRVEQYAETEESGVQWAFQRAHGNGSGMNFILHILPNRVFEDIRAAMAKHNLNLTRVVSLYALFHGAIKRLSLQGDQIVLIASQIGGAIALVACRCDGQILFGRMLLASWKSDLSRVETEINRSILFVRQQFNLSISRIVLLGEGAEAVKAGMSSKYGNVYEIIARRWEPFNWLSETVKLSLRHPANLVGVYSWRKRRRRVFSQLLGGFCWLIFAVSIFTCFDTEQRLDILKLRLGVLSQRLETLTQRRDYLMQRNAGGWSDFQIIAETVKNQKPPATLHFLNHAAEHLPFNLRLTQFMIKSTKDDSAWKFRFDGLGESDANETVVALQEFEEILRSGPFRVSVTLSNNSEAGSLFARRSFSNPPGFFIEGEFLRL